MPHIMNTTPHQGCAKKPYQTPELVVLSEAAEMTQNTLGFNMDTGAGQDTGS